MEDLEKEYNELVTEKNKIIDELNELKSKEIIKRYMKLKEENELLYNKQIELYKRIKINEYDNCKHILVYSKIEYDSFEERSYRSRGCIKCGLDNSVLDEDKRLLSFNKKIMYDYLRAGRYLSKKATYMCDIDLATAIYKRIKEVYPCIDDETATKYFEIALDNIRNIKVSKERKQSRAKRLGLNLNFKNWDANDIFY